MASRKTAKQEEAQRKREARAAEKAAAAGVSPDEKAKRERTTEREVGKRIAEAEGLLLRGWTERRVAAEIAHNYNLSFRTGQDYVTRVKEMWAERVAARKADTRTPEEIDLEHRNRGLMLLDECLKAKELKAAGTVYKLLMELDGRGTNRKLELSGGLKHQIDASPDTMARVDDILKRHGYAPEGAPPGESK